MTSKFRSNLKELKETARRASKENREKINDIIRLYEEKRIKNFLTAENAVNRLAIQTRSKGRIERAEADYKKIMEKYSEAEPMTGRLDREIDAKRRSGQQKTYGVTMILFRKAEPSERNQRQVEDKDLTINVDVESKAEMQAIKRVAKRRTFADLVQFYIGSFDIRLDNVDYLYLKSVEELLLRKGEGKRGGDVKGTKKINRTTAADFGKVAKLLASKNVIFKNLMEMTGYSYLEAIYLTQIFDSETKGHAFEPKTKRNRDTHKVATYYRFTTTELDLEATTFKEAIAKSNYVKDECFLNTIYDFYRDNLLRSDKSRNVITRASILETIGKTEENVKEGLSIEEVLPFFVKYRLQLRVFNKFCKLEFKYDPPQRNHHNKAMFCMMADGHIYTLNHDVKRIEQKEDEELARDYTPKVGDAYVIKDECKPAPAKMFSDLEDIRAIVQDMGPPELDDKGKPIPRFLKLIHRDDDLMMILNALIDAGYYPGINFDAGKVSALKLEFNSIFCIIETQQLIKSAIDGVVVVDSEETYNNMSLAMANLGSKLFLKSHLSYYTSEDIDVLDSCRTKPICGMIEKPADARKLSNLIEIDVSKAYTAAFCDIDEIPIFNEFDSFKPYEGEPILPLNLYIVKDFAHPLSTQSVCLVYGKYLQEGMKITAFKQPSFIKQVNYKKIIDELYEKKISEDEQQDVYVKKLIANVNIGLLEKSFNRKSVGYIFQDYEECKFYQAQFGGVIHCVQQIETTTYNADECPHGLDDGVEDLGETLHFKFESRGDPYYVLQIKAEKQLRNGFRYIKELLLQGHNFKLMNAYDILKQAGVPVTSVKTDCFTIPAKCEQLVRELLPFNQAMGNWRVSKTEGIVFPFEKLSVQEVADFTIEKKQVAHISVSNEWDVGELCDKFEQHKRVMVRAEFAGCGKSHACRSMEQRGHKVLFVCPTNKLAQNNKENGVTLNVFFGVGMTDDVTQKMAKFDDSAYDVIVFDEIYFANIRMMAKIKRYSEQNPGKIILATGDTKQLETIDLVSDQIDYETYMDHCIDTVFPHSVTLKENKRLTHQSDKDTLRRFKDDVFNESIPLSKTIKKYFKFTDKVETTNNIAYRNSTCESVAKDVRKLLRKTAAYEVGEVLVCRKYLKTSKFKCSVNFEYRIKAVKSNSVVLSDGPATMEINRETVDKHFIHSYCRTCHSFQGSSINDRITVFDWKFFFVSRKWIYTAVTRATELKNVVFFNGATSGDEAANDSILDAYLEKKVSNYVKQDLERGREVTENFVTKEWLKAQFGKVCHDCGDCFRFDIRDGRVESNLSADRVDCSECHHLNNIVPLCVSCNQRKSCW